MSAGHPGTDEVVLEGGFTNRGLISRAGHTVRRPLRPTSDATRALLDHLERAGFDGAPRHLGRDAQGREVLTYIDGEVATEPQEGWALGDEALVSVAQLLRRFHDAAASFDPAPHAWPRPVPEAFRDGLVCHNDPNLDNVVFSGGQAVALIDFDLAGPASAVWDVACAARLWAPLRDGPDAPGSTQEHALRRLRLFADAYGLGASDRARLPAAVVAAHAWAYDVVREAVGEGHAAFIGFWRDGGRARAERTARWLAVNEAAMRRALVG